MSNHYTFDRINEVTGFANGEKFTSPQQLRMYFTTDSLRMIFGARYEPVSQSELDDMAETVLSHGWHCNCPRIVTLINQFHMTLIRVRVAADGTISDGQRKRIERTLCGIATCQCDAPQRNYYLDPTSNPSNGPCRWTVRIKWACVR